MSKKQIDPEEEQRTTALGLFNYAQSFAKAASALAAAKLKTTHHQTPVEYLYYHSIELYLKAFLRSHGKTASELRTKFGHDITKLRACAECHGLVLSPHDRELLAMLETSDLVIEARYIRTGFKPGVPAPSSLEETCGSLRDSTATVLKHAGQSVRIF